MLHSKFFRIILLLIFVISILLIFRSLMSRMENRNGTPDEGNILPEEIIRKTTDFEHTQLKNGKALFRVIAGSSTMKTGGDNILERVSLWRFGDSDEPSDMIEGEEAVYNPEKKEILFTGDVVIRLERGILIYADQVQGDLAKENLLIREDYRMEHESVLGQGNGLEYKFVSRLFRFINGVDMVMDHDSGRTEIDAQSGLYLIDSGKISLEGNARIESPQSTIHGEQIDAEMDENDQIIRLNSRGNSRVKLDQENIFSGAGIFMDISDGYLTVLGSDARKAVFLGGGETGSRKISSDAIYCSFLPGPDDSWTLEKVKAEGDVRLELPENQLEECRAEFFQGVLAPGGNGQFESINLSKNVYLAHGSPGDSRETMQGQNLWMEMDENGYPELVQVEKDVSADLSRFIDGEMVENRKLEVRDNLRMRYAKGVIQEIVGRTGCRLTGSAGELEDNLEANLMRLEFREGLLVQASADGDVRGRSSDGRTERKLSSDHLDLFYDDGVFSVFEQSGSVALLETGSDGSFEIGAESSRYDSGSQILTAEEGRPFLVVTKSGQDGLQKLETRARQILISREENLLKASGSVESIYDLEELPLVFVSSFMESDLAGGQVEYTGDVRLLLEENIIKGDKMLLNSDNRALLVEGSVDTKLLDRDQKDLTEYRIVSGKLDLDTEAGTATYEENVEFDSDGLRIEAPFLVLYMESGQMKEFSRIEAWGGVTIREEGRVWTGERAVYLKETGRVVVDGE